MSPRRSGAEREEFDYVIIGAGSAGSVLAQRLTEDGTATVCVLEAGPRDRNPFIHIPAGFIKTLLDPAITWPFRAEPSAWTAGRAIALAQGKTLGGSSSINGHVYNRGQARDFDAWAQNGNAGWGYADVLPYFKRTERRIGTCDPAFRGRDGGLAVTDIDWIHPICEAFLAGTAELGIPRNPDYNAERQDGAGYYQRAILRGRRISAARAFLYPAMQRPNLAVRTRAHATAVLFQGRRAVGVDYAGEQGGPVTRVFARREIILCGGTINSPRLLQVSGIGPRRLLNDLGVPVVQELPGVGENLRDHYAVRIVARAKGVRTINDQVRGLRLAGEVARWLLGRPSVLALSPSLAYVFSKSHAGLDRPDLQFTFTPASYKEGAVGVLDRFPGMTCGVWQQRPESAGHVRACSADVFVPPQIQPNYLADAADRRVLIRGLRIARDLLGTSGLKLYFEREELPGADVVTDDALLDFARQRGSTVFHLIGTCRMGPSFDRLSVVDDQLRVRGIEGLRVADASIMPTMPSANTNATTLMIAEKAADLIRGRHPLAAGA